MAFKTFIAAVALLALLPGCASHLYNIAGEQSSPVIAKPLGSPINRAPATSAGRILLQSGIASYRPDSRAPATLVDLGTADATPLHRSFYKGGLVPASLHRTRKFRIVEKTPTHSIATDYQVAYLEKASLWERFHFFHDDEATLARALAWSYAGEKGNAMHTAPRLQKH